MKTSKNHVSYFEAGYRAALIDRGLNKSAVERMFYRGIVYPNRVIELLQKYDTFEFDDDGLEVMERHAMKTRKRLV